MLSEPLTRGLNQVGPVILECCTFEFRPRTRICNILGFQARRHYTFNASKNKTRPVILLIFGSSPAVVPNGSAVRLFLLGLLVLLLLGLGGLSRASDLLDVAADAATPAVLAFLGSSRGASGMGTHAFAVDFVHHGIHTRALQQSAHCSLNLLAMSRVTYIAPLMNEAPIMTAIPNIVKCLGLPTDHAIATQIRRNCMKIVITVICSS